jgi:NitT/TauT family transport system substrate-binding protein
MNRMAQKTIAAAAVLLPVLAACGGGDDTGSQGSGGDDGGNVALTVGAIPIVDTAPIWLGKEKGFFEEEGIDLEIEVTSGGAAAVPGVVSGEFEFAFGNLVSVMVARDQGLDLRFVANGVSTTGDTENDFSGVVVAGGSDIRSPADLAGNRVGVNNLNNIGDTTIRHIVEQDGGDPEDMKFVEVGFPDAPAALEQGNVEAAWILEPFLSAAVGNDGRVVTYNYAEFHPELDIAGYFTSAEYMDANPDIVDGFTAAMNRSLEYAQENPGEVRDIVGTYTEIPEETRQQMILPAFRAEFSREAAQKLGEAAVKYDTLQSEPDLESMLP